MKPIQITISLFLPQQYFQALVKPIVNKLNWTDSGSHLDRLNNIFTIFYHIIDGFKEC